MSILTQYKSAIWWNYTRNSWFGCTCRL